MVNVMVYQMVFIVGKQLLVPMAWQGILNGSDKKGFLPQMDKVWFGGGAWLACRTPKFPVWNIIMAAFYEKCQR